MYNESIIYKNTIENMIYKYKSLKSFLLHFFLLLYKTYQGSALLWTHDGAQSPPPPRLVPVFNITSSHKKHMLFIIIL